MHFSNVNFNDKFLFHEIPHRKQFRKELISRDMPQTNDEIEATDTKVQIVQKRKRSELDFLKEDAKDFLREAKPKKTSRNTKVIIQKEAQQPAIPLKKRIINESVFNAIDLTDRNTNITVNTVSKKILDGNLNSKKTDTPDPKKRDRTPNANEKQLGNAKKTQRDFFDFDLLTLATAIGERNFKRANIFLLKLCETPEHDAHRFNQVIYGCKAILESLEDANDFKLCGDAKFLIAQSHFMVGYSMQYNNNKKPNSENTEQNLRPILEHYEKSIEFGSSLARLNASDILKLLNKIPEAINHLENYLKSAMEFDYMPYNQLGVLHEMSCKGRSPDLDKAKEYYLKGHKAGCDKSTFDLARLLENEENSQVIPNLWARREVCSLYGKAAGNNEPNACYNLGVIHSKGWINGEVDQHTAEIYLRKAYNIAKDDKYHPYALGEILYKNSQKLDKTRFNEAIQLLNEAIIPNSIDFTSLEALYLLGELYSNGWENNGLWEDINCGEAIKNFTKFLDLFNTLKATDADLEKMKNDSESNLAKLKIMLTNNNMIIN